MLNFSSAEVLQSFESSKNINAAFKKFLKNDVANDATNIKFLKSLKQAFSAKDSSVKLAFIEKHLPQFQPHLLVIGRYAFLEPVDALTEQIITRFAEEFNTTYAKGEKGVEVKNVERFNQIISEVISIIDDSFEKQVLPASNFMKAILLNSIFDAEVLQVVIPLVKL